MFVVLVTVGGTSLDLKLFYFVLRSCNLSLVSTTDFAR